VTQLWAQDDDYMPNPDAEVASDDERSVHTESAESSPVCVCVSVCLSPSLSLCVFAALFSTLVLRNHGRRRGVSQSMRDMSQSMGDVTSLVCMCQGVSMVCACICHLG
jgi:hypothetical protein